MKKAAPNVSLLTWICGHTRFQMNQNLQASFFFAFSIKQSKAQLQPFVVCMWGFLHAVALYVISEEEESQICLYFLQLSVDSFGRGAHSGNSLSVCML